MVLQAQNYTFITYNIRYANPADGLNAWDNRKENVVGQIMFHEPDVFGIQEGLYGQVAYLDEELTGYSYYGVGRDDGDRAGEFSAFYFRDDRLSLKQKGTFWLSETPDMPSKGWDAALPRICSYGLLEDKGSKQRFWVFNAHFDHVGKQARTHSMILILDKIKELNQQDYPVILMGDFNLTPDSEPVRYMTRHMKDTREASENPPFGPLGTWNAFDFTTPVTKRIDYIAVSKEDVAVKKYAVLSDSDSLRYYSDHLPVFAEVVFTK